MMLTKYAVINVIRIRSISLNLSKKNIGRNPIVDCERNGEKNRKRMEKNRKGQNRIEKRKEQNRK